LVDQTQPKLSGIQPRADAREWRADAALKRLGRLGHLMANETVTRLTIEHHATPAFGIAQTSIQWRRDPVPIDREADKIRACLRCRRQMTDGNGDANTPRGSCDGQRVQAFCSFTLLSGSVCTGLPVAAKIAFKTAGAATQIVGSPTPPQNPPDGMTMVSIFGKSANCMLS
jgi:hypothetical protein